MDHGQVLIYRFVVSPLRSNCYLVVCADTKEAVIVDPGDDSQELRKQIQKSAVTVRYLLATHGHLDHLLGASLWKKDTGAAFLMSEKDWAMAQEAHHHALLYGWKAASVPEPNGFIGDGDEIAFGRQKVSVWETPGHSPGHLCFVVGRSPVHLFSGDLIFAGSVGRTDFPGGDPAEMERSLKRVIGSLPDDCIIHPGHGPETTVGNERLSNSFLRF